MLPLPEAVQLEPDVAEQLQVAPVRVAGTESSTLTFSASDGPPLLTVIVYVALVPGTAEVLPSSLLIDRSTSGVSVSVSVDESLPALVSVSLDPGVSLAPLVSVPRASAAIVPVSV